MAEATLLRSILEGKPGWDHTVLTGLNTNKGDIVGELISRSLVHIAANADLSTKEHQVLHGVILLQFSDRWINPNTSK